MITVWPIVVLSGWWTEAYYAVVVGVEMLLPWIFTEDRPKESISGFQMLAQFRPGPIVSPAG
jgi:hypothetical protein